MAWTTPRTWSAGETLTAANFNTHIRDNLNAIYQVSKMKASDETVNNSSALQDDNDFFFTVAASEKWGVELHLILDTNTTADWKGNWTKPAATTITHTYAYGAGGAALVDWTTGDSLIVAATSSAQAVHLWAAVIVSTTAGTVQFQWAQATANASNTILKAGSYMIATRMN